MNFQWAFIPKFEKRELLLSLLNHVAVLSNKFPVKPLLSFQLFQERFCTNLMGLGLLIKVCKVHWFE